MAKKADNNTKNKNPKKSEKRLIIQRNYGILKSGNAVYYFK